MDRPDGGLWMSVALTAIAAENQGQEIAQKAAEQRAKVKGNRL